MVNDISIIAVIITVFILVGGLLPIIQGAFSVDKDINDIGRLETEVGEAVSDLGNTTQRPTFTRPFAAFKIFDVIASIASMFVWTFGALPFWMDLAIFTPLRLVLAAILVRNIWVGGGG